MKTRKEYLHDYWIKNSNRIKEYRVEVRIQTLTHYGFEGKLQCCWPDCLVTDIDLLTLDHINNDGAQHRKNNHNRGVSLYAKLIAANFPEGYQTLCWNHQWKKELIRLRSGS